MPSSGQIEFDVLIVSLSFAAGLITNKRFKLFIQVALLIFKMAKWYHDTHPEGRRNARRYDYDEKLTQLYEKHLMPYDKELKTSSQSDAEG